MVVGIITLAAAEATAFLAVQKLTALEKAGLAALAAGVGAVLVLPIIYACALVAAPHRQQKWKAAKIAGLETEHASRERQERTEGQFAAAILAGDEITAGGRPRKDGPLMAATKTRRGARVAQARRKKGLSQQALADRIGTARSTVARVEIGFTTPTLDVALALARELDSSVEALFGGGR